MPPSREEARKQALFYLWQILQKPVRSVFNKLLKAMVDQQKQGTTGCYRKGLSASVCMVFSLNLSGGTQKDGARVRGSSCLDRGIKHCLASRRKVNRLCCPKRTGENPLPRQREQKKSSRSEGRTGTQCVPRPTNETYWRGWDSTEQGHGKERQTEEGIEPMSRYTRNYTLNVITFLASPDSGGSMG